MDKEDVSERLVIKSRDELVKFMDDQTKWLIENPDCFKDFLVMASVMDMIKNKYDIGDKILIFSQNPDARILNSKYVWERRGLCVKDNSNPILILGKKGSIKEIYNASQTKGGLGFIPRLSFADSGEAAEIIVRVRPCKIKFEVIDNTCKYAFYKYDDHVISVTNGCKSYDSIYRDLVCEYAHFEIARYKREKYILKARKEKREEKTYKYQRKLYAFHAKCATYALCKMYGVDPGNYDYSEVIDSWHTMSPEQIREEIKIIHWAIRRIDDRIQKLLGKISMGYYDEDDYNSEDSGADNSEFESDETDWGKGG